MAARILNTRPAASFLGNSVAPTRLWVRSMAQSALSSPMTLKNSSNTKIPKLVYGTAWKTDRTADLVYQALKAGFRGVDTAAQPKHYQEHLVGDGIRRAISEGIVTREDLYVCLFFTWLRSESDIKHDASDPNQIHPSLRAGPKEHALQRLSTT